MKKMKTVFIIITLMILANGYTSAKGKNHLSECWKKQVSPLQGQFLNFYYHETLNELEHSFEPWQATHYTGNGNIWCSANQFIKSDTLLNGTRTYFSKTQFDSAALLFLDYGDQSLFAVTQNMFLQEYYKSARYSPAIVINYFYQHHSAPDNESDKCNAIYTLTIAKTIVKLFINKKKNLLERITTINHEDLYGDVNNSYTYHEIEQAGKLYYPRKVVIHKTNGKLIDTVALLVSGFDQNVTSIITKPADYKMNEEVPAKPELFTEKFSDNIHFVALKHTDGRAMVVEFKDFLLVAEAPLNSENGELIINEAKKIAPGKPIRYFVFGHYHPDYIGGIRAFIHQDAKVLCTKGDTAYVSYLAKAQHTLQPDNLQLQPHPLQMDMIESNKTITDGNYEMKIYFIGSKSEHTNDYLIYYFPAEKLLFEGDLISISADGPVRKAGKRQAGLYNAVKELGLDVKTIVQSWPVANYGVKTQMPFSDLALSMQPTK